MAVYVDNVKIEWRGKRWCHLVADSLDELHDFAKRLGLKRKWFQCQASYPHYDITVEAREQALCMGALIGNRKVIIASAKAMKLEMENKKNGDGIQLLLFATDAVVAMDCVSE